MFQVWLGKRVKEQARSLENTDVCSACDVMLLAESICEMMMMKGMVELEMAVDLPAEPQVMLSSILVVENQCT